MKITKINVGTYIIIAIRGYTIYEFYAMNITKFKPVILNKYINFNAFFETYINILFNYLLNNICVRCDHYT